MSYKSAKFKLIKIARKRHKKKLVRLRKQKKYDKYLKSIDKEFEFKKKIDYLIILREKNELKNFLKASNFISDSSLKIQKIEVPENFCLIENYEAAMKVLKEFSNVTFFNWSKEIFVDFTNCKKIDLSALFVLQILRMEYGEMFRKLDRKLHVLKISPKFTCKESKDDEVNKLLHLAGLLTWTKFFEKGLIPLFTLGYQKGQKFQRHYSENSKGILGTKIVNFLENCLYTYGYLINAPGKNHLEGLISEILGNAEDHSPFQSYYLNAFYLKEMITEGNKEPVGEINLFFVNFGESIAAGFEKTKDENKPMYDLMSKLFDEVKVKLEPSLCKENLFTLYALQEGISRLKFEDQSRGTGTMKFINSFFSFGDFEDLNRGYIPKLSIISGSSQLLCDNRFKPFMKDGIFSISLNTEQDLQFPPSPTHIKNHASPFPGTLLSVKIYLNKEHIENKKINVGS